MDNITDLDEFRKSKKTQKRKFLFGRVGNLAALIAAPIILLGSAHYAGTQYAQLYKIKLAHARAIEQHIGQQKETIGETRLRIPTYRRLLAEANQFQAQTLAEPPSYSKQIRLQTAKEEIQTTQRELKRQQETIRQKQKEIKESQRRLQETQKTAKAMKPWVNRLKGIGIK